MRGPTYVQAAAISRWATGSRDAQGTLPLLVRRLVHATTVVQRIGFPAGDSVSRPGWDGIVVSELGSAFVPNGTSVWEMGTDARPAAKAERDYDKRTKDAAGVNPATTTFVFVTPHPWRDKDDWAAKKKAEAPWMDVVVIDADSLEQWLEIAPSVHVWFSILAGKHPPGAEDLSSFWDAYAAVTNPPTTPGMLLAGRQEVAKAIRAACATPGSRHIVSAETREEAIAVIAASIQAIDEEERVQLLSRALITRDEQAFRETTAFAPPLILVPVGQRAELVARAAQAGHVMLLPFDRADASDPKAAIPRLDPEKVEEALVAAGVPKRRARELALTARRSFPAFRRQISPLPDIHRPPWADPAVGPSLLPILFAGQWLTSNRKSDRDAVGALSGRGYAAVQEVLTRWAAEADPAVRRVGEVWYALSRDDLWAQLYRYLTPEDLERFRSVALDVLRRTDPKFELAASEQWTAGLSGHVLPHSHQLREGLAEMIALLGARGDGVSLGGGVTAATIAERLVRELLLDAPWQRWASLESVLPLLAEAAPAVFLTAVERGLTGGDPVLKHLFMDQEDTMFRPTPHTGLLWALETLAHAPEHLPRVTLALGALARLDSPRGKLGNRPDASLVQIYRAWYPQTDASLDERIAALTALVDREPDVAWGVLTELVPHPFDHAIDTPGPRWRDWGSAPQERSAPVEVQEAAERIGALLVARLTVSPERWPQVIKIFPNLAASTQRDLLDALGALDPATLAPKDRLGLWTAMRTLVSEHRSWADRRRRGNKEIEALATHLDRFAPADPIDAAAWLFERRVFLPEGREKDFDRYAKLVDQRRTGAVRQLVAELGLVNALELAGRVEAPEAMGHALARADVLPEDAADALLAEHLDAATPVGALAVGFAYIRSQDAAWVERQRARDGWSPAQRARLLLLMPMTRATWEIVAKESADVQRSYWKHMWMYGLQEDDVEYVAERFIDHGRPFGAVELLGHHLRRKTPLPPDLLIRAMEAALHAGENDDRPDPSTFGYTAAEILTALEGADVDQSRVASVEWALLPALSHHVRSPKILHAEMSRNPEFFIEVLSYLYRAKDEPPREDFTDEERALAKHAWHLLDTWELVPGTRENGTIDADALNAWVHAARARAAEVGRSAIADDQIGSMLIGAAPEGEIWPPPAVCDVIERLQSEALDTGFDAAVMNSRGFHSKGFREGGVQEIALAEKYEAHAARVRARWPHVAAVLEGIARDYRHQAQRGDDEAELRTDGLD